MQIKTKFNVGDTAFCIDSERKEKDVKCHVCEGIGKIIYKRFKKLKCPNCNGDKTITRYYEKEFIVCDKIESIPINIYKDEKKKLITYIRYKLSGTWREQDESEVFKTKKGTENFLKRKK